MKIDNMIWKGKRNFSQRARTNFSCDISVKSYLSAGKTKARFIIRNGMSALLSETDYLQFSIPDRKHIYFMTGSQNTGLKMTTQDKKEGGNRYVQINKEDDAEELVSFAGDYEICYDKECELYYIQR